jgi:uncharacterized protein (UPF0303 family)
MEAKVFSSFTYMICFSLGEKLESKYKEDKDARFQKI